jgi:hypothetical protein
MAEHSRPPLTSQSSQNPYGEPDPFSDHPRQHGYDDGPRDPFASSTTLTHHEFGVRGPDFDDEDEKVPLSQGQSGFAGGFYPPPP